MAAFLIVITVGVVTLALAAESVVPTAFNRHMIDMAPMMTYLLPISPQTGWDVINYSLTPLSKEQSNH